VPSTPPISRGYDVDDSEFPIVIVRAKGKVTDGEFEQYLRALDKVYSRHQRFALVWDGTKADGGTAAQRRRQAEWMRQQAMLIRTFNVGTAFVIPSALTRGALTAILWLQPMPSPHFICESPPEAIRWARKRLAEGGAFGPPTGLTPAGNE